MTLIEVVLSVGLSTMIVVPLIMWGWFAMAEQDRSHDRMSSTAVAAFLTTWFGKDVTGALEVTTTGATGCDPAPAGTGRVVLALRSGSAQLLRTTYVEVTRPTASGEETVLLRRKCIDGGAMVSQNDLGEVVASSSAARCIPATGPDACRRVELVTTPVGSHVPVAVTATRRVDRDPVTGGATGNRPPTARIVADTLSIPKNGTVNFSGASSSDREGAVASWDWEFPGNQTRSGVTQSWTFTTPGQIPVVLSVTDAAGATNTTFMTIEVINALPFAVAAANPNTGDLSTPFTFSAAGSSDPDGAVVSYTWNFGEGESETTTSQSITHVFPPTASLGSRTVELVVADDDGATSSTSITITLVLKAPVTIAVSSDQVPTDPGGAAPTLGNLSTASPTVTVRYSPAIDPQSGFGTILTWSWTVMKAGATVTTSTEQSPPALPVSVAGTYTVILTVTNGSNQSAMAVRQFKVAPPAPAAPRFPGTGWVISWDPIAGADSYSVVITQSDAFCPGDRVTVLPARVVTTTSLNLGSQPPPVCGLTVRFDAQIAVTIDGATSLLSPKRLRS